jgi:hypothetical protein
MKVITAEELSALFPWESAMKLALFPDSNYALPTTAWLLGPFWSWYQGRRFELGLHKWTRANDCDNSARAYCQAAADCHASTMGSSDKAPEGVAVGEYFYTKDSGGGHAIVVAVTEKGIIYIEPQTGVEINLSDMEKLSCMFVRF